MGPESVEHVEPPVSKTMLQIFYQCLDVYFHWPCHDRLLDDQIDVCTLRERLFHRNDCDADFGGGVMLYFCVRISA